MASESPTTETVEGVETAEAVALEWYVCDRDGALLRSESSLDNACEWAMSYSRTTSVASTHEIEPHDYLYVLADPTSPGTQWQVRILRSDRASAIGIGGEERQPRFGR